MPRCWEFLGCKLTDCKLYGVKEGRECWESEETGNCSSYLHDAMKQTLSKLEACKLCIYYKEKHPVEQ